jgi:hypothetical protein
MARIVRNNRPEAASFQLSGRKLAALIAHAASFYATYLFIASLAGEGLSSLVIATMLEVFLHIGKTILLNHSSRDVVGIGCFLIDTFLNAGGIYPAVKQLNTTSSWQMAAAAIATEPLVRPTTAAIIALALGALLSIAPILLWKEK